LVTRITKPEETDPQTEVWVLRFLHNLGGQAQRLRIWIRNAAFRLPLCCVPGHRFGTASGLQ
jgi:hypothetical protein